MKKCEKCGKEVVFSFTCTYCGKDYCGEHRLPENHECSNQPTEPPPYISPPALPENQTPKIGICPKCHFAQGDMIAYDAESMTFKCGICGFRYAQLKASPHEYVEPGDKPESKETLTSQTPKSRRHFPIRKVIGSLLAIMIVGTLVWYAPTIIPYFQNLLSQSNSSSPNYAELVNYALTLINSDRTSNALSTANLSSVDSGQMHADDMLKNIYFSHWGTDGSKPYMRYTLAGGRGAVAENIATYTQGAPSDVKTALRDLENDMMNNDAASNWGHRNNILNPFHNEVSIGISYGNGRLYFVEDFIDDYVRWSTFTVVQNQVSLAGTLSKQMPLSQIDIFYDSCPSNLANYQLDNPPYSGAYSQGTFVGMALPPNYQSQEGITITAQTWIQSSQTFQIEFNVSPAFNHYGKGIYTLYLQTSNQDSLTTYSIWLD